MYKITSGDIVNAGLFSNNYLPNKPIHVAMIKFARSFSPDQHVLDIGCGAKPYAKYFSCRYTGLDHTDHFNPDIVAPAWKIPFSDDHFDGVIINQALEHIEKTAETIQEVHRVLKPESKAIVTVPQTMKNHGNAQALSSAPADNIDQNQFPQWQADYFRFTKYGLAILFKDFQIVSIIETNGYFSTQFQLINYFFASFGHHLLFSPVYFINNILGLSSDYLGRAICSINHPLAVKFKNFIFFSLTINLILIVKKTPLKNDNLP